MIEGVARAMYQQDSFFTLSVPGQVGLAGLSVVLTVLMLFLTSRFTRPYPVLVRVALALALFLAFDWLSPQAYYTYYRTILPGLPDQWVVASAPDPFATLRLLVFSGKADLSAHGRGVLGWAMVAVALLSRVRRYPSEP